MLVSLCLLMGLVMSVSSSFFQKLEKPEVREIKVRLEEEKAKRLLLQNDVEILMLKVEQLERKCDDSENEKTSTGLAGTTQVKEKISFSARLSVQTVLDKHHVVTFDQVLHNHGNGYSSNTGIFKAPVAGTYVFSMSMLTDGKGIYFHLSIMKSGTEIARVFSGSDESSWPDQGSVTVVTSLTEDDEVYVWEFHATATLHGGSYCTFMGFQIQ